MNTKYTMLFSTIVIGSLFSSCDNFLELNPRDFQSEAIYFKNKEDFVYAANALHPNVYTWKDPKMWDGGSDIISLETDEGNGINKVPTDDNSWKDTYKWLRQINQVIAKGEVYNNPDEIASSIGQAYFFRAWQHFFLVKRFGGVPIATYVPDVSSDIVWGKRNSRYEVIAQILKDLDVSIEKLQQSNTTVETTNNDGHVTLEAAKALKARVCLFEGTWEKYVGTETDGDGVQEGAGSFKPDGYPTIDQFLTMAKELSHDVMTNPAFSLWKGVEVVSDAIPNGAELYGHTSYYYYFNLEDAGSNPNGMDKSSDHESIFRTVYDFVNRPGGINMSHSCPVGPTRKLMDMFLCKDGLPPHLSQYKPDYMKMTSEFDNRDYRMTSCVKRPFTHYWSYGATGGCSDYNNDLKSYPESDSRFFYVPMLRGNASASGGLSGGYGGRKFTTEMAARETTKESMDFRHIRLAEMYLIYAEAVCELGNGEISDKDLNISINKLRERAGVALLSHALIAPYPELTMLGEIRRERALELFGEGHRISDLCRWGVAEEEMAGYPVCGVYLSYNGQMTEYTTAISPIDNSPIYTPDSYIGMTTTEEISVSSYKGIARIQPGAAIMLQSGNRQFSRKNYLQPIPSNQMTLNPNLLQNPGW